MERKLKQIQERGSMSTIHQKVHRLTKNVMSMQDIFDDLMEKKMLSEDAVDNITMFFSDRELEVVMNYKMGSEKCETYPPTVVRAFAMTLQFYSARAYEYIQETYNICLPHSQTVLSWYKSEDGKAGFQEEAFSALKEKSKESTNGFLLCNLLMDEMDLTEEDGYDFNNKCYGYIDIGVKFDDTGDIPDATRALVFMIKSLTDQWKIPVAYFLFKYMNAAEKANVMNLCIKKLYDAGVLIVSVTLDGVYDALVMNNLSVPLDTVGTSTSFAHPCNPNETVSICFDPHHMLKSLRETLTVNHILVDSEGNEIKWQYIKELEKLQHNKSRLFAIEHNIQSFLGIMNTGLPEQVFNNSVADALSYCNETLKLPQFNKCSATVKFIRHVAKLFDILSSENPLAKGSKSPMCDNNKHDWQPFFTEMIAYFKSLRLADGKLVIQKDWFKIGVLGFIGTMVTCMKVFNACVNEKSALEHILCSNFSKDPLEKFFAVIRKPSGGGNPPSSFLESVWKELSMNVKDMLTCKSDCCEIVSRCPSLKKMETYFKCHGMGSYDDLY